MPTLVILAAGRSRRYGAPKPLVALGPHGETLPEYTAYDALAAGFARLVFVVHPDTGAAIETHMRARLPRALEVAFVEQRPPEQVPVRDKPWGTAAAVLAAAPELGGDFAVANADDLYGRAALQLAAGHLIRGPANEHAIIAYRLDETLSAAGGVSRAVCSVAADGTLREVEELLELRREGGRILGRSVRGRTPTRILGTEPVSMNLWVFRAGLLPLLRTAYATFLAARARDPEAEFLIGEVIRELVVSAAARVRVLQCTSRWHGITYPADRPAVAAALAERTRTGHYPSPLGGP